MYLSAYKLGLVASESSVDVYRLQATTILNILHVPHGLSSRVMGSLEGKDSSTKQKFNQKPCVGQLLLKVHFQPINVYYYLGQATYCHSKICWFFVSTLPPLQPWPPQVPTVWMNPDRSPLPRVWPLAAQFIKPATQVFGTQVQI